MYYVFDYGGDGEPATVGWLNFPTGIFATSGSTLLIADTGNERVRCVDDVGILSTVAGDGTANFTGDDIPAVDAALYTPCGVVVDGAGNVIFSDSDNGRVRVIGEGGSKGNSVTPSASIGASASSARTHSISAAPSHTSAGGEPGASTVASLPVAAIASGVAALVVLLVCVAATAFVCGRRSAGYASIAKPPPVGSSDIGRPMDSDSVASDASRTAESATG